MLRSRKGQEGWRFPPREYGRPALRGPKAVVPFRAVFPRGRGDGSMSDAQKVLILLLLVAGGWLLYLLGPILTPFLAAALLAYLGDPVVDRIEARRVPRGIAVVVVFLGLLLILAALLFLLVPLIDSQIRTLVAQIPEYIDRIQESILPRAREFLGLPAGGSALEAVKRSVTVHWQEAGGMAAAAAARISQSGLMLAGWLANLVLIPVVTFYLLRDWDYLMEGIRGLLPRDRETTVVQLARESDEVLAGFLRGQLLVMVALGGIYSVGLWLVGLDLAFLVGLIAGLVNFVPYLGFIIGLVLAEAGMALQTGQILDMALVLVVFMVGQVLEGTLLTPNLVGDRIGLHPVAVIFAVLAGGQLFGFVGVLLALPAAAVLAVFLRHARQRYLDSDLYQAGGSTS